ARGRSEGPASRNGRVTGFHARFAAKHVVETARWLTSLGIAPVSTLRQRFLEGIDPPWRAGQDDRPPLKSISWYTSRAAEVYSDRENVLSYRPRIEWRQSIVQAPMICPCLLPPAGHVEDEAENFPSNLLQCGFPGGNTAGIDVDQVRPALCQGG